MTVQYKTIFDLPSKGFEWWPTVLSLAAAVVFLIASRVIKGKRILLASLAGIAVLFGLVTFTLMYSNFSRVRNAYHSGAYKVVDGTVEQFQPKSQAGGGYETFKVNDVSFLYSDYESTPGFNQTASHGGPIREGLRVRITYVFDGESSPHRNVIVKLEVAHPQ